VTVMRRGETSLVVGIVVVGGAFLYLQSLGGSTDSAFKGRGFTQYGCF